MFHTSDVPIRIGSRWGSTAVTHCLWMVIKPQADPKLTRAALAEGWARSSLYSQDNDPPKGQRQRAELREGKQREPSFLELPLFWFPSHSSNIISHLQSCPELFYSPSSPLLPNSQSIDPSPRSRVGWRVSPFLLKFHSVQTAEQTSVRGLQACPNVLSFSISICKEDLNILLSPKDETSDQSVWWAYL